MKNLIERTATVALATTVFAGILDLFLSADFDLDLKGIGQELEKDLMHMPQ